MAGTGTQGRTLWAGIRAKVSKGRDGQCERYCPYFCLHTRDHKARSAKTTHLPQESRGASQCSEGRGAAVPVAVGVPLQDELGLKRKRKRIPLRYRACSQSHFRVFRLAEAKCFSDRGAQRQARG